MALYAIGDLHLHFGAECKAPMQRTDPAWRGHVKRVQTNCQTILKPEATLVLVGDHSWGKDLAQAQPDLAFIASLPGKKVLLRGNHDQFWEVGKTARLNALYEGRLFFLQNNFFPCGDYALVGTKGYCFEGPFYLDRRGRVKGWDESGYAQAEKLVDRELARLRRSLESARAAGYNRYILFLHYPPTNLLQRRSAFTDLAEEYGAHQVVYAHSHGQARFHDSIQGDFRSITYSLVSGDYLGWMPKKLLP